MYLAKHKNHICLLILCFLPLSVLAQSSGSSRLWTLGLAAQAGDDSSRGTLVSFGTLLDESTWFSAVLAESSSPFNRANVEVSTFAVGINHEFERWGFNVDLERWGDSGALESGDVLIGAYFQGDHVRFRFGIERRDIDISLSLAQRNDRFRNPKLPLSADGLWVGLRWFARTRIEFFYDYKEYDYSRNLAGLPRLDAFNLLSASALTLANSFISDQHSIGTDIKFGERSLSLVYDIDTSAIDRSKLSNLSASLILPVAARLGLDLSIGRSDSDLFSGGSWAGIGFLFYGGG